MAARGPMGSWNRSERTITLTNGRLELAIEAASAPNAWSLRDLKSLRTLSDRAYRWHGVERPALASEPELAEGADGACTVTLRAVAGPVEIVQTFAASRGEPDVITESVTLANPGSDAVRLPDFRCGFARLVHDGGRWTEDASRLCDVPYRYHPETGELRDFSVQDLATKESWYSTVRSPIYERQKSATWGAEGWAWYGGGSVLLVFKYNPDDLEWSLLDIAGEALDGTEGKILLFGGAGRWKLGDPQAPARMLPGTRYSFGITRYQMLDGGWKEAYAACRRFTEGLGHRVPSGFDPPVHWNELYDNRLWWVGDSAENRRIHYQRRDMELEADKAKELGCQCLYLDPGWDTVFGSNIWAADRLGSQESFVAWLKDAYGMPLALHTPLAPWSDPAGYPPEARRMDRDRTRLAEPGAAGPAYKDTADLCCASSVYIDAKVARLNDLCDRGAYFLMYDGSWFPGECWDPSHGHSLPVTHREHLEAILAIAQRVHARHPDVLIEQHDPMTGPGTPRYTPTYLMHGKPGAFDELWGYEYMIDPMDDILSKRAFSLYDVNLAYSIPIYLHIDLRKDNEHAMMLWWYASTCRHLGVGGTPADPRVREAQKRAMRTYREHKRFFAQGVFHGLDETVHAHTLSDVSQCVLNCFNLDEAPRRKRLRFRLEEIGLPPGQARIEGAAGRQDGSEVTMELDVPGRGHRLVKILA